MSDLYASRFPETSPQEIAGGYARFADGPSRGVRASARNHDEGRPLAMPAGPGGVGESHDLDARIAGLSALRSLTLGDPRVTLVILDGDPDLTLPCFYGDQVSKVYPYWHERAEPITHAQHALFREISNSDLPREQKNELFLAAFPVEMLVRCAVDRHATLIASIIAGGRGTPTPGLAPNCRVIVVPLAEPGDQGEFISSLNLARAFDLAHDLGADLIHCSACVPTQTDAPHDLLARAVKRCLDDNILIVSPAGNNAGDCRCFPAVLPGTLAVGALKDDGSPFKFSNWGGAYSTQGVMAPGEKILAAEPGSDEPVREMGTSVAAPIVTGIAALLMSWQLQLGRRIDAAAIRAALLSTTTPCELSGVDEPERCLRGVVNLPAAFDMLFAPGAGMGIGGGARPAERNDTAPRTGATASAVALADEPEAAIQPGASAVHDVARASTLVLPLDSGSIKQSTAHSGLVYALGRLSYDFGSEIGQQEFEQYMTLQAAPDLPERPTPHDVKQLIDYLDRTRTERDCLIWTLVIDGSPVYGLVPDGPFDDAVYEIFLDILAAQNLPQDNVDFVERISVPGRRTGKTIRLHSKEEIPILAVTDLRGIYGWNIQGLVGDAVSSVYGAEPSPARLALADALTGFLNRIYFDLHNLGQTSRDRAMNFAVTNLFQAAAAFSEAIDDGRALDTIVVKKSPVCRMHSDCWNVSLTFFDPNDEKRATKIFEFTIDVADAMPVSVGHVKSWFQRRRP